MTKKIAKRTVFIFKKNAYNVIKSDPTTTSEPTTTTITSLTGIVDFGHRR